MTEPVCPAPTAAPASPSPCLGAALSKARGLVMLCAIIGLLFGVALALLWPGMRSASTTLLFTGASDTTASAREARDTGGDPAKAAPPVSPGAASVLLRSRSAAKNVLRDLRDGRVGDAINLEEVWHVSYAQAIARLQSRTTCRIGAHGELTITVQDPDPERAELLAGAYVGALRAMLTDLNLDPSTRTLERLGVRIDETERELKKRRLALLQFQKKSGIVAISEQSNLLAQQYAEIQQQMRGAQIEGKVAIRQANTKAASAGQMLKEFMDPSELPDGPVGTQYKRVRDLEADLSYLKAKHADEDDVAAKEKELKQAYATLKGEVQRQVRLLSSGSSPVVNEAIVRASAASARLAGLQNALKDVEKRMQQLPEQQAVYTQLTGDVQVQMQTLSMLKGEYEEYRTAQDARVPAFVEVDPPEVPAGANRAGQVKTAIRGLLVGLVLGLLLPTLGWVTRRRTPRPVPPVEPCLVDEVPEETLAEESPVAETPAPDDASFSTTEPPPVEETA